MFFMLRLFIVTIFMAHSISAFSVEIANNTQALPYYEYKFISTCDQVFQKESLLGETGVEKFSEIGTTYQDIINSSVDGEKKLVGIQKPLKKNVRDDGSITLEAKISYNGRSKNISFDFNSFFLSILFYEALDVAQEGIMRKWVLVRNTNPECPRLFISSSENFIKRELKNKRFEGFGFLATSLERTQLVLRTKLVECIKRPYQTFAARRVDPLLRDEDDSESEDSFNERRVQTYEAFMEWMRLAMKSVFYHRHGYWLLQNSELINANNFNSEFINSDTGSREYATKNFLTCLKSNQDTSSIVSFSNFSLNDPLPLKLFPMGNNTDEQFAELKEILWVSITHAEDMLEEENERGKREFQALEDSNSEAVAQTSGQIGGFDISFIPSPEALDSCEHPRNFSREDCIQETIEEYSDFTMRLMEE